MVNINIRRPYEFVPNKNGTGNTFNNYLPELEKEFEEAIIIYTDLQDKEMPVKEALKHGTWSFIEVDGIKYVLNVYELAAEMCTDDSVVLVGSESLIRVSFRTGTPIVQHTYIR